MTAGLPCPRCGTPSDAGSAFCPHCGRYLAALQWVAEPPPSTVRPRAVPRPRRYTGPPRYRERPRGGFPAAPWRPPDAPPAPPPPWSARRLAAVVGPLLWVLAAVALLAAGAEVWRYALLLGSRDRALSADSVAASDALVLAAGTGALLLTLGAGCLVVTWTVRASGEAAARSGSRPSRAPRDVVLGWVVPGLNLAVPGSVLAEIEHGALDRDPAARPTPSRLLRVWWAAWALGVLAALLAMAWSRRTGVQALADGVVLHAVIDLLAAATAGLTAVVVGRLTALLGPVRGRRREVVLAITPPTAPAAPA